MNVIKGVQVIVLRPLSDSVDEFNNPIATWLEETVDNVLIAPGTSEDIPGHLRGEGDVSTLKLHFPKTYTNGLRGCRILVLDRVWAVEGDPLPFMVENTPTRWNRPVTASLVEG